MKYKMFVRPTVLLTCMIFVNSVHLIAQLDQRDSPYRLPAGTRIRLKMDVELSSKFASVNDTFVASVVSPVIANETVVLPAGSIVEGRVTEVERAAHAGRDGKLDVVFESLKLAYGTRKIDGVFASGPMKEQTSKSVLTCLLEVIALKKGSEARIRKDQEFEIELRKEVTLPVFAY
jgi:hypothetical protein